MKKVLLFFAPILILQTLVMSAVKRPATKLPTKSIFREGEKNTYHYAIWVDGKEYKGDIPVSKNENMDEISDDKWYFNCALFDPENPETPINIFSFPASLMPPKEKFDEFKPRGLIFMPNGKFLSIENGLFKYNIFAEKDPTSGKIWTSVDFGKRTPISLMTIDKTYQPWGNEKGNIYFKIKRKDGSSVFYMWDSTTGVAKPQRTIPTPPKSERFDIEESEEDITVKFNETKLVVSKTAEREIIDPLSIKEKRLIGGFEGYGTEEKPFTKQDYETFEETGQIEIGIILELKKLLDKEEDIIFDSELSLSETEIYELKRTINDMFETYQKKTRLIRELKKVFREYGPKGLLKKWLNETEYNAILTALNPEKGGAGVSEKFDHKGHTEIINLHEVTVPLGYYRMLKAKSQRGFPKLQWADYSSEKEDILIKTIRKYTKRYFMSQPNWKEYLLSVLKEFLKVPDQKDWIDWFEKRNKNLEFELLFDYLVGLTEEQKTALFKGAGMSSIRQRKMKLILDMYRKSPLSPGVAS